MPTFATIPIKLAPRRKFIDFALPVWKNKIGEFDSPDILSWVNNLYQDKMFPTRSEFNLAYDEQRCNWDNKTMIISKEDLEALEEEYNGGAFEDTTAPGMVAKFLEKARKALANEKVIYVY
jgi:hypothetical protein